MTTTTANLLIEEILRTYEQKSLTELQSYITKIETEIHNTVTTHHTDLLAQTTNVELLDDVVLKTQSRTKNVLNNVKKLNENLDALDKDLEGRIREQENLYQAHEMISIFQQVLEFDRLIEKEKNLSDVALYLSNMEYLCTYAKLDRLKPYREKAQSLTHNIEKQTENILIQGLNAGSQAEVGRALQIFVNLNSVNSKISKVVTETEKLIEKDVKTSMNLKLGNEGTTPSAPPQPGRASSLSTKLSEKNKKQIWTNLETLIGKIIVHTGKIKFLYHVMKSGKDVNSNQQFASFVDESIWTKFWNGFMDILVHNLGAVGIEAVKILFEDEFPKLLSILSSMATQVEDCKDLKINVSLSSGLRGVTLNYEKAFLSKSLAKLFDNVNHMFAKAGGTCPPLSGIDSLVQLINKETNLEDPMLKKLIARNVTKTIQLVCVRAEELCVNDGDATQVIGPATESQTANSRIVNFLEHLRVQLRSEDAALVSTLMENILNPLVQAIGDTIEAILLTMHQENFKRTAKTTEYSLYMGELATFISRVAKDYLSLYDPSEVLHKCSLQLATRTIKSKIANVTLVANITPDVKKQLLIDLTYLETTLTPICPVLQDGLKFLRAFRNIFQMNPTEIKASQLVGSIIPLSYVVHLIINQTEGQIKGPLALKNWSVPRYLRWLEDRSEADKLGLLKSCVENYVEIVTSKGETAFHPNYPVLMDLLRSPVS